MVRPETHRRLVVGVLFVVGVQVLWLARGFGGRTGTTAFTDLIGFAASAAAAFACFIAFRRTTGRTRLAWLLMALGLVGYALGDAVWSFYEVILGRDAPFPSIADVGYMLLYPFGIASLVQFPTSPHRGVTRLRAVLDGMIIAGSVLLICWSLVIGPVFATRSGRLLDQIVSLAYPVGDLVLIWIVVFVLFRCAARDRTTFALIGGGLFVIALADSIFTYLDVHGAYISGSFIDPMWTGGMLLIFLGALHRPSFAAATRDERWIAPLWGSFPYIPLVLAVVCAMGIQITQGALPPFAFWTAVVVILFVTARQIVALADNHSLNTDLDLRVQARTRELEKAMGEREETFRELLAVRTQAEDKLMTALAAEQAAANDLRQADSMRAAFLMAISHELRTPLTAVIGFSTMLDDALDDFSHEEIAESIASIAKQSQRLERLLMDLLDVERLTRGTIEPRLADTDIEALVRACAERVRNGRRMWMAVEPGLRANIDPALTERILENLVVNANKHTPDGTQIFVVARRHGSDLQLSVEDDGPGVPDAIKQRIFEPFEQGDVPSHAPGTGVGLALVAKFTALQGGRAWVEDRPGGGASFHVVFPGSVDAPPVALPAPSRTAA